MIEVRKILSFNTISHLGALLWIAGLFSACLGSDRAFCELDSDCLECELCREGACVRDDACNQCQDTETCTDGIDNDCDGKTDEGCADLCEDVSCDTPPANECLNEDALSVYAAAGTCENGECLYDSWNVNCEDGCEDGGCRGEPCAGIVCNHPPDPCNQEEGNCVEGVCHYPAFADGTACDDDDPCTKSDACQEGVCSGYALSCDTPPNLCFQAQGNCLDGECHYDYDNGTSCTDGDSCTFDDVCLDGSCGGTQITCDDPPNACYQAQGSCEAGQCTYQYDDEASCDDGDSCTSGDTCSQGSCAGSTMACDDPPNSCFQSQGSCEDGQCQYAFNTSTCNDGNSCTVNDTCAQGSCVGTAMACDSPPNACYGSGSCNDGECLYEVDNNATCTDGDSCTVSDSCHDGICLGTAMTCSTPPNSCYQDQGSCADGQCQYGFQNNIGCNDSDSCTANDSCQNGVCTGTAMVCDTPPNGCYQDPGTCSNGQCQYAYDNGATCTDGDACTTTDRCYNGSCAGTPMTCNTPPNDCYQDLGACSAGQCHYDFDNQASCTDGDGCTGNDSCYDGICLGSAIVCDNPPNGCYVDTGTCSNDQCQYNYNNSATCNDGDACTTNDTCNNGGCVGTEITCTNEPSTYCYNASTLRTYSNGSCDQGQCNYPYQDTTCQNGCENAACLSCSGDNFEPDNNSSDAVLLEVDTPQTHSICPAGDDDWWAFTISAPTKVSIETTPATAADDGADTYLYLYDVSLTELDRDDDDGVNAFSYLGIGLQAGTYYVKLTDYGDDSEIEGYDITMQQCEAQCGSQECGPDPVCGVDCGVCPSGECCDQGSCGTCDTGLEWVQIPAASFIMGSDSGDADEMPTHSVSVPAFEISRTEVTVSQYQACVDAGACNNNASDDNCNQPADRLDHPINCVTHYQAEHYCAWAGSRLPTESEWESAARGGGQNILFPWGNEDATCDYAVVDDPNAGGIGCGLEHTFAVCSKTLGNSSQNLCDMGGNVWEWTQDAYHSTYDGAPNDGSAWLDSSITQRAIRSGCFTCDGFYARCANRTYKEEADYNTTIGIRCVK